jgi:hypothetical protein
MNAAHVTLSAYLQDPDLMLETQVRTKEWLDQNLLSDDAVATPESGWPLIVDLQNYLELAWLGGAVEFDRPEPHVLPFLSEEGQSALLQTAPPAAFDRIGADVRRFYERFHERKRTYSYNGIGIGPISMPYNMTGTDGPFTLACGLRGAGSFLLDLFDRPDDAHALLNWLTEAIIHRIREVRIYLGEPALSKGYGFADDAIVMLSPDMYCDFVLPCHRRIFEALCEPGADRSMHLCGDAQRFFPIIQKELGVMQFDTGFPIDFAALYDELSPETRIYGGVMTGMLLSGTTEQIDAEVRRILSSGVMQKSRRFVLREANSLAPRTPFENVNQMYRTCLEVGFYPVEGTANA